MKLGVKLRSIPAKICLFFETIFGRLRGFYFRSKKILLAVFLYAILILVFAFLYKTAYVSSVRTAKEILEKRVKQTAWSLAIELYQLTQNKIKNGDIIERESIVSLEGIKENLAFAFSEVENFLVGSDKFGAKITAKADLRFVDSVSRFGSPLYHLTTVYFWSPKYTKRNDFLEDSTSESNPFYGERYPYEWAPPGVFDNPYQLPFEIFPSKHSRVISVTAPRSVFVEECAKEIEMHLRFFITKEIEKWLKIGKFSNFLYFSSTFGLGDIVPNSARVRQLIIFQVFLGALISAILIPRLLTSQK